MDLALVQRLFRITVGVEREAQLFEFLWHAGEPLSVGLPYMRSVMGHLTREGRPGGKVGNSIQTNGTLLNKEWAAFFKEHAFGVGVSIDGPPELHDRNRVNWSNRPSHASVMRGIEHLKREGLSPGVLCVLTDETLDRPEALMEFFAKNELTSIAFNLEEIENANTTTSFSANRMLRLTETKQRAHRFFQAIFDYWWPRRDKFRIREFEDIFECLSYLKRDAQFRRRPLEVVSGGIFSVTRDGDISGFSPEFSGGLSVEYSDFKVGHITSVDDIFCVEQHPVNRKLLSDIETADKICASDCPYYTVCGSAFLSNRFYENGSLTEVVTFTCEIMRKTLTDVVVGRLSAIGATYKAPAS